MQERVGGKDGEAGCEKGVGSLWLCKVCSTGRSWVHVPLQQAQKQLHQLCPCPPLRFLGQDFGNVTPNVTTQ